MGKAAGGARSDTCTDSWELGAAAGSKRKGFQSLTDRSWPAVKQYLPSSKAMVHDANANASVSVSVSVSGEWGAILVVHPSSFGEEGAEGRAIPVKTTACTGP